jgi:D-beta-D-heptose 7-phosphate kinase/D-beta-D-heptose 1-phosphate adenosyltransferase
MKDYSNFKILIVGDSCSDVFIYGFVYRLAPEGPIPIFNPERSTKNGGMALNVKSNVKVIGSEPFLITQKEEIVKTRYVDERTNSLLLRVDTNDKASSIDKHTIEKIKDNYYEGIYYDAVIVSDYCKGFLSEEDIDFIARNNKNVFLDTKKLLGNWCKNVSFIKINHVEYQHTEYTIHELGIEDKLIITLSSKGCQHKGKIYPVEKVQIRDVSGAGDTFLSGLVAEYVLTNDIEKSILFAQQCATVVVQKPGVSTI